MVAEEPNAKRARVAAGAPEAAVQLTQKALHHVAARHKPGHTLGLGPIIQKGGLRTKRIHGSEECDTLVLGGACSEVFTGPRLAKVLSPAVELQKRYVECLARNEPAEPLSIHTSCGVPSGLGGFVEALKEHLPWKEPGNDWFVNLQLEGTTAVWAGVEILMTVANKEDPKRTHVAVGELSYHGPKTTGLGQVAQPLWPGAPVAAGQLAYPLPTGTSPSGGDFLKRFDAFLEEHGSKLGVLLFEPQSGSTFGARPWKKELLQAAVQRTKAKGIKVLCDEIMCGLGRHGQGALYLSKVWDLEPDLVTFGKSIAAGPYPLSGVIAKTGREFFASPVVQIHTYAGSSNLALLTATEVLKELPRWFEHARKMGEVVREVLAPIGDDKFVTLHGLGLLQGIVFATTCPDLLKKQYEALVEACRREGVWPYLLPSKGCVLTPPMDVDEADFREALQRLRKAFETVKAQTQS